jgi:uncharacterized protein (DUF305 family)
MNWARSVWSYPRVWVYETLAMRNFRSSGRRTRWALLAFIGVVLLAGCTGDSDDVQRSGVGEPNIVQAGAPGEPSTRLSEGDVADVKPTPHTQADVDFMEGMIHHHAQALLMTSLVRERSASPDIPLLARRTEISQEAEIETMEKWLIARDEKPPDEEDHRTGHGPGAGLMPGMVSAGKLARLAAAEGREFDRLFLEYMTRHHRGALTMVRRLAAASGGAEPEIGLFTRHVEADQNIEIDRMQDLLAELEGEPNRSAPRRDPASREAKEQLSRGADAGATPLICYVG